MGKGEGLDTTTLVPILKPTTWGRRGWLDKERWERERDGREGKNIGQREGERITAQQ